MLATQQKTLEQIQDEIAAMPLLQAEYHEAAHAYMLEVRYKRDHSSYAADTYMTELISKQGFQIQNSPNGLLLFRTRSKQ